MLFRMKNIRTKFEIEKIKAPRVTGGLFLKRNLDGRLNLGGRHRNKGGVTATPEGRCRRAKMKS